MLPQASRLKKNSDFTKVLGLDNRRRFGPLLIFHSQGVETARFGFIVSKKVSKKAVERNKLRRVLVAVVRQLVGENNITGDWVMMVLFRPEKPFQDFTEAITQWQKKLPSF